MRIQAYRQVSNLDDAYILEVDGKYGTGGLIARSIEERKALARELIAAAEFFIEGINEEPK